MGTFRKKTKPLKNNCDPDRFMDSKGKRNDGVAGSFEIHGIALSYNYIAGAHAIIVSGAEGRMIDAVVLGPRSGPDEALRIIHLYDAAARSRSLRASGGISGDISLLLDALPDDLRRRHTLDGIQDVVCCAESLARRDYVDFAARIARKGHFKGVEIARDQDGAYTMSFSTNLGAQQDISAGTVEDLVQALVDELEKARETIRHFKRASYHAALAETLGALQDILSLISRIRSASGHLRDAFDAGSARQFALSH